jgi:hypothetical protein
LVVALNVAEVDASPPLKDAREAKVDVPLIAVVVPERAPTVVAPRVVGPDVDVIPAVKVANPP